MRRAYLFLGLVMLAGCSPYYQGPPSDHFDGERFFNPSRPMTNSFGTFLRWKMGLHPAGTPPRAEWPTSAPPRGTGPGGLAVPAARVMGNQLVVTSIGHASFLVQTQGLNILLDPVFAERASPVSWAGPKRITPPGIAWEKLPPIDLVLVSHNHYEHLCLPTLQNLVARDNPTILTPLGNEKIIHSRIPNAKVITKDWSESLTFSPSLTVTLEPMQHWSARGLADRRKALWAAMVLQTPGGSIYWAGDTGYGLADKAGVWFAEAGAKYPNLRLSILPIGAYEPRWFMQYAHMNPEEAVKAFAKTGAAYGIGHHFGVFHLTDEPWLQPTEHLAHALQTHNVPATRFRPLWPGEVWNIPARP